LSAAIVLSRASFFQTKRRGNVNNAEQRQGKTQFAIRNTHPTMVEEESTYTEGQVYEDHETVIMYSALAYHSAWI
jgi:hypothetical protein